MHLAGFTISAVTVSPISSAGGLPSPKFSIGVKDYPKRKAKDQSQRDHQFFDFIFHHDFNFK